MKSTSVALMDELGTQSQSSGYSSVYVMGSAIRHNPHRLPKRPLGGGLLSVLAPSCLVPTSGTYVNWRLQSTTEEY